MNLEELTGKDISQIKRQWARQGATSHQFRLLIWIFRPWPPAMPLASGMSLPMRCRQRVRPAVYRCWQFFDGIGLKGRIRPGGCSAKDRTHSVGADTHTSAPKRMEIPILELMDWIQSAQALASGARKRKRGSELVTRNYEISFKIGAQMAGNLTPKTMSSSSGALGQAERPDRDRQRAEKPAKLGNLRTEVLQACV